MKTDNGKIQISIDEALTIAQFVGDGNAGKVAKTQVDIDIAQLDLSKLIDSKRKVPEAGDIVITGDITCNGGTIDVYRVSRFNGGDDICKGTHHFIASDLKSILIEPVGYPEVEPYDRQSPYYNGCSYDQLMKQETAQFSVYTEKCSPDLDSRQLHTSFNAFWYNEYWKSLRFGLAIKTEDIPEFLEIFLILLGYDGAVRKIIIDYVNTIY